jgi:hypothetical protein
LAQGKLLYTFPLAHLLQSLGRFACLLGRELGQKFLIDGMEQGFQQLSTG